MSEPLDTATVTTKATATPAATGSSSTAADRKEPELETDEYLNVFIDFFYAAIFAVGLDKAFEIVPNVLWPPHEKAGPFIAFSAVFALVIGDWIGGRDITHKFPYRKGRIRFSVDVADAICAFGALRLALADPIFIWFLAGCFVLSAAWALCVLYEHPNPDKYKGHLIAVTGTDLLAAILLIGGYLFGYNFQTTGPALALLAGVAVWKVVTVALGNWLQ